MRRNRIRWGVGAACGTALFLVGLIGFAHTPAGRPMLSTVGRLFRGKACPLGYDRAATPEARESQRAQFAALHRGPARAVGKPALGFDLDHASRTTVASSLKARGVDCRAASAVADLVCENVSGQALPEEFRVNATRDMWFNFGRNDKLISVVAVSRATTAPQASAAFRDVCHTIGRRAGPTTHTSGYADAQWLNAGSLHQATNEFAFTDYFASARATNMGKDFLLIEEYRSLVN